MNSGNVETPQVTQGPPNQDDATSDAIKSIVNKLTPTCKYLQLMFFFKFD